MKVHRVVLQCLLVCCIIGLLFAVPAAANINGAIYTTFGDGTTVNGNLYASKDLVYLDGGPQNMHGQGLPSGNYYFQVTDPSGAVLLSLDDVTCRVVHVSDGTDGGVNGRMYGVPTDNAGGFGNHACYHTPGSVNPSNGSLAVQLCSATAQGGCPGALPPGPQLSYYDTPNHGGEYKVWLTPVGDYVGENETCSTGRNVHGFCDSDVKTDNFKVRNPNAAYVSVCKFNDLNGNGTEDPGEPLLPNWPIVATGVDGGTVYTQTDSTGCVSFVYSGAFPDGGQVITLTEGSVTGWTETAPLNSATCTFTAGNAPPSSCSVSNFVITLTLNKGDDVQAPDFGNNCSSGTCGTPPPVVLVASKTAMTSLQYTWGISKTVDSTQINTPPNPGTGTFNYTVTVTHDNGSNWMLSGTITVANFTDSDVGGVNVSDLLDPDGLGGSLSNGICTISDTSTGITVPAMQAVQLQYSCTYSATPAPYSGVNQVTVTWDSGTSSTSNTANYDFNNPTTVIDGSVTVTDTLGGTLGTVTYTQTSPQTFTYPYTVTGTPGTCTTQNNTATFTANTTGATGSSSESVKVCVGADLTVTKTAATAFTRTYNWTITKVAGPNSCPSGMGYYIPAGNACIATTGGSNGTFNYTVTASETGFTDSGWQMTGSIMVTNPNDWEDISGVSVTDTLDAGSNGTCNVTNGTGVTIARSSSATLNYVCTFPAGPPPVPPSPYSGTNTGTATWNATTFYTADVSKNGTAPYNFNNATVTHVNQTITVTDNFNNMGAVTLGTLTATDTTPYASATYTEMHTVAAPVGSCATYNNTATITQTNQSSSQSAVICGGANLSVMKTANPGFTSNIVKSASQTIIETGGNSATFNYTVTVTESGWNVSGMITVSNPNTWEDVPVTVTDVIDNGGTCVVNGGANAATVPHGNIYGNGTALLPYVCTYASRPTGVSGTNSAGASWNAMTAFTSLNSAIGTATYAFTTLTITDHVESSAFPPPTGCDATLGTVSVTTTTPSGSPNCGLANLASPQWGVFTYSITDANAPPAACVSYNNTAMITGGSSSNQVTVTVCNTRSGALTMGFWKNNNGQGIISRYCSPSGGTSLHTFLTLLNPFKDDMATNCSGEASYVNHVITAATCGGSTCNPMLKAQMLATALDVYFSDPALGGNKIGAYNGLGNSTPPLGGVNINLSKVCAMIDSSGGGSCSGSYEDARPEFGINPVGPPNPCLGTTVSHMLLYADAMSAVNGTPVSNSGGSIWYKQTKNPKQVYAKDSFDTFNNQVANIAPSGAVCDPTF